MDYHELHSKPNICSKHNQPIVVVNHKIGHCCVICLQLLPGNVPIEQFNQQQQAAYDKEYKEMDLEHNQFQSLLDEIQKYKQTMISKLDKIISLIIDQINIIKDSKLKMNSIIQSDCNKEIVIQEIQQFAHKQKLKNKDVQDKVVSLLKSFQLQFGQMDQLFSIFQSNKQDEENVLMNKENNTQDIDEIEKECAALNQIVEMLNYSMSMNEKIKIQDVEKKKITQFKKIGYELITALTVKCQYLPPFAFNNSNTVLLVGYYQEIIIYEISKGIELKRLTGHSDTVNCFSVMKKSNSFISGSADGTIIIWALDQNKEWIDQQVFKEHNSVDCILLNKMEDKFVLGCKDKTLAFWRRTSNGQGWKFWSKGGWKFQQSIETKAEVQNIAFNETEDKLLVCENQTNTEKSYIQVLMQNNNKQWNIVQTLDFDGCGWGLCFTIREQFVFKTEKSGFLEIYDYDKIKKRFYKVSLLLNLTIKDFFGKFSCQYIESLSILTFIHGEYLYIIKVNENYNYELIQEISLGMQIYGSMSDNGQYFATWSRISKEIQISRMIDLE